ncbi:RINT1-like protein MAG2 [Miscanthus floridulus]|uniref:RINT1-like protein MAG2 n=1 Tax=Miscanthus floridulus TaxID=154761 RepID=UPI0034581C60
MEAAAQSHPFPLLQDIDPGVRRFLDARFRSAADLATASDVEAEIRGHCAGLEASISNLYVRLQEAAAAYSSCCEVAGSALRGVRGGLGALKASGSTGAGEEVEVRMEQMQFEQLPALASEVARVEMVREYAEMALKLDSLVGDIEDAVSSSVTGKLKSPVDNSEKTHHVAIGYLKNIEDLLASVTTTRPQWTRLLSSVDHRVDRSLAILRPQAIVDHRSLLSSLGWPPSLAGSKFSSIDSGKQAEIVNPLFSMRGDLKSKYSESFLALCNLQELQKRRKARQLKGHDVGNQLRQPLWVIEELVNPISTAAQHHFSKWAEKPEFVFALAYKIIRDFVDSMDEILQPIVDKANLIGYSCREEWISGMVIALSTYLVKEIFPKQIELLQESSSSSDAVSTAYQASVSWLSLVDLMISFDKRIQGLISGTGLLLVVKDDDSWQRISVLCVFCDRPDWLQVWAEIERQESLNKLQSAMDLEKNWSARIQGTMLEYDSDDCKSPLITSAVHQTLSLLIDRARPIPSITLRAEFIRMSAAPIISEFLGYMLRRCQEAEGLTALADDNAVLKVSQSINAARYFESTLTEWCEDVFFLEMENLPVNGEGGCIFQQEINHLKEFRVEWADKISTVILRGFDARSRDYLKNRRQWLEKSEGPAVSRTFIESLDYMQGQLSRLQGGLNTVDFVTVWRSVASGVDQLLFGGIFTSGIKISSDGVERLQGDLSVLFAIFSAWCLRPEGFFPRLSEGLRLLKIDEQQLKDGAFTDKNWLREYGIRHLTAADTEKIIKNRVYDA